MLPESLESTTSLPSESNNNKIQLVIPQPGNSDEAHECKTSGDDVAAKTLPPAMVHNVLYSIIICYVM